MDALLIPTFFCPKAWEGMAGDESKRFCSYCHKHIHNLDALSAGERLALLSSPAANLCARYRVAVRRPVKGREKSYYRHLLKYGAGVAAACSAFVVLWEMDGAAEKERYYQSAGRASDCPMPEEYYEEQQGYLKGDVDYSEVRKRRELIQAREVAKGEARQVAALRIDKQTLDEMLENVAKETVAPDQTK